MSFLIYLLLGSIFGFGLAYSGMTDPLKVLGFLDIFGAWDVTLAFVMGGGVTVTLIAYHVILKRNTPALTDTFCLPNAKSIDGKLLGGALLFGIGWGLYGYCPGPAVAALSYFHSDTYLFVISMIIGIWINQRKRI